MCSPTGNADGLESAFEQLRLSVSHEIDGRLAARSAALDARERALDARERAIQAREQEVGRRGRLSCPSSAANSNIGAAVSITTEGPNAESMTVNQLPCRSSNTSSAGSGLVASATSDQSGSQSEPGQLRSHVGQQNVKTSLFGSSYEVDELSTRDGRAVTDQRSSLFGNADKGPRPAKHNSLFGAYNGTAESATAGSSESQFTPGQPGTELVCDGRMASVNGGRQLDPICSADATVPPQRSSLFGNYIPGNADGTCADRSCLGNPSNCDGAFKQGAALAANSSQGSATSPKLSKPDGVSDVATGSSTPGKASQLRAQFERRSVTADSEKEPRKTWAPTIANVVLPDGSGTTKVHVGGEIGGSYKQKTMFSKAPPARTSLADLP